MLKVVEVRTKKQLKKFVTFPFKLYSDNPYWIPPLLVDEMNTLRWDKNPAFSYCKARYWLVYKDNKLAGRIAGIINQRAIESGVRNTPGLDGLTLSMIRMWQNAFSSSLRIGPGRKGCPVSRAPWGFAI
ncbi:MAG: hypothetical protein ACOX27_04150 [Caldicoprobacterales bacterium]